MRGGWNARRALAIAAGGAAGAALRWAVVSAVETDQFPWPVFFVNAAGSILLGVLLAEEWPHPRYRLLLHDFGGIGFCGGLTTFSTFSLEVVNLARNSETGLAVVYAVASISAALLGVSLGAAALQRFHAVTIRLEEEP